MVMQIKIKLLHYYLTNIISGPLGKKKKKKTVTFKEVKVSL